MMPSFDAPPLHGTSAAPDKLRVARRIGKPQGFGQRDLSRHRAAAERRSQLEPAA